MYVVIDCTDHPDRGAIRAAHRAEHRAWLARVSNRILSAGPKLDPTGKTPIGSLLIIDFPSLEAAREFADGDPYRREGLFDTVVLYPYLPIFPARSNSPG